MSRTTLARTFLWHWTIFSSITSAQCITEKEKIMVLRNARPIWNYERDYSLNCTTWSPIHRTYNEIREEYDIGINYLTGRYIQLLRTCLYGLAYPRQLFPRDDFTKRFYENCVTEPQFTLLNYAYIQDEINIIICPYFFVVRPLLSVAAFSHSENGPIHQYFNKQ